MHACEDSSTDTVLFSHIIVLFRTTKYTRREQKNHDSEHTHYQDMMRKKKRENFGNVIPLGCRYAPVSSSSPAST